MSVLDKPQKAVVSVVEMSRMVGFSKSRFYVLIQPGIFPRPVQHEFCKRPVHDLEQQQMCLEIRRTGIAHNGQPVLFNRKRKKTDQKARQGRQTATIEHAELAEALKSLGLATTPGVVESLESTA